MHEDNGFHFFCHAHLQTPNKGDAKGGLNFYQALTIQAVPLAQCWLGLYPNSLALFKQSWWPKLEKQNTAGVHLLRMESPGQP